MPPFWRSRFEQARNLSLFWLVERNLQRLQEAQILRRNLEFGLALLLFEDLLIHLDVQRLEEPAVVRRDLGGVRLAARQANGGVELQYDIVTRGANSGNRFGNSVGFGNRVVNRVAQFAKQALQVVVDLQSRSPLHGTSGIVGAAARRNKSRSERCCSTCCSTRLRVAGVIRRKPHEHPLSLPLVPIVQIGSRTAAFLV